MEKTQELLARRADRLVEWGITVTPDIFEQMGSAIDKAFKVLEAGDDDA